MDKYPYPRSSRCGTTYAAKVPAVESRIVFVGEALGTLRGTQLRLPFHELYVTSLERTRVMRELYAERYEYRKVLQCMKRTLTCWAFTNGEEYARFRSNNSVAPVRTPSATLTSTAESMVTVHEPSLPQHSTTYVRVNGERFSRRTRTEDYKPGRADAICKTAERSARSSPSAPIGAVTNAQDVRSRVWTPDKV